MSSKRSRAARRLVVALAAVFMLIPAGSASAGRLIATGHDADHHCGRETNEPKDGAAHAQCHFVEVAVNYVRGGAPDPTKPVLVLDRGALDVVSSLDRIYGPGVVPRHIVDPRSAAFKQVQITTDNYSAMIIASSGGDPSDPTPQDLNGVNGAPDSEAINARSRDIQTFFDQGGGIYVNSGNFYGDGDTAEDIYYGFLPITVRSAKVTEPFALTDVGRSLGFNDYDVTCCPTHNVFEPPSPDSALKSIDIDAKGKVVSLVADTPKFTTLGDPPVTPAVTQETARDLPRSGSCVRKRTLRLKIRRPRNFRFSRATIYVNKKRVKRVRGRKVTRPIKVSLRHRRFDNAVLYKVRIVVITTGKRKINIRRVYSACR